ncbi:MFS transporter [Paenibacillus sp.]|uniref:MFS transporter n=1 Tax=Paenibacillus sp. TaxID=58172 RepID=UPI002D4A15A3|nr:MFS transporter [Paenibacillus sp.]HZG57540.1 MFS transporter [Paenibacillus sp.]
MGYLNGWTRLRAMRLAVPPEKRLSREAATTIALHSFFQLGASMSGVFLTLYLWRLTESLAVNALYSLLSFAVGPLAFAVAGKFAKTRDRLFTYRLGIGLTALFYLLVIVAGARVADYYYAFALLGGTAGALYWLGYLTLMNDVSTDANRIRYLGFNSIMFNLAGLAGPAAAGFLIGLADGLQGYMLVFTTAFVMFVAAAIGSFRLKEAASHHRAYYLRMLPLLFRKDRPFRHSLYGWFFMGTYQGLLLFLPNLLLFSVLGREDWVGYAGVGLLGLTIGTSYALTRRGVPELARRYAVFGAAAFVAGAGTMLLFGIRLWTVGVFAISYYAFIPLLVNSFSAYSYRLVGRLPLRGHLRVESIVARETFLNAGRVAALGMILAFASDLRSPWIAVVLLGAALLQFNFAWIIKRDPGGEPTGRAAAAVPPDASPAGTPKGRRPSSL